MGRDPSTAGDLVDVTSGQGEHLRPMVRPYTSVIIIT
jgi:hypothetical protein